MADQKISALTAATSVAGEDLVHFVDDPNGTPTNKKITVDEIFGAVPSNTVFTGGVSVSGANLQIATTATPANSTAAGVVGSVQWDSSYIYVCTSANVWKRVALTSF
tara:strand:+ start:7906 stop:8226 length:321 start_codon:yes stop_codon:yes gene_type:complete